MSKILLFAFLITSTWSSYADEPTIINGKKTNGHKPVVKLTIGKSSCTGTFIKKGYILTAAHCVASLSDQLFTQASLNAITARDVDEQLIFPILISDEKKGRVLDVFIMPNAQNIFKINGSITSVYDSLATIKIMLDEKKISGPEANKLLKGYIDAIAGKGDEMLNSPENIFKDLAIIKVVPNQSDKVYKLASAKSYVGETVTLVGFGANISRKLVTDINDDIVRDSQHLERETNPAKRNVLQSKIDKSIAKLTEAFGVKRVGSNTIEGLNNLSYTITGSSEDDEVSWYEWTKYFYSWKEATGKDVSATNGDSGGPLLKLTNGSYEIIGVFSTFIDLANNTNVNIMKKYEKGKFDNKMIGKQINSHISISSNEAQNFINQVLN